MDSWTKDTWVVILGTPLIISEMPTSGNLKSGDSLFCIIPPPNIKEQHLPPPQPRPLDKHNILFDPVQHMGMA